MTAFLLVFLGAGLGGAARYGVHLGCARMCGPDYPWGTLTVNVAGSFAMGVIVAALAMRIGDSESWSHNLRLFLTTGILGGFTTFSAFSLDAIALWERGEMFSAGAYVAASVAGSILALGAALFLVRGLS